ncbi:MULTISPECIES: IS21 family transposase [unclassified Caballeronia]|uniref:IS21 family transposase n=1 Tax=unclassified Caballeronia TaxID=2646786 RepID=UPI002854A112|nr:MULTISPECIES: IS21 family transposase [unclassified Caballeronia]MDR5775927.1 IS21 family transposase [Caballeronia sp. LZ002]MDR5801934.1 IS21 family transposase [Caballeronia sp. LZ001]MDR5851366.1 IS21 family transposase [Caballeronia sp. LZ003]
MPTQARHASIEDFLALTDGLCFKDIARLLRCCLRTVKNYVAGRSPIPWHRIQILRTLLDDSCDAPKCECVPETPNDDVSVVANIDEGLATEDVPPEELLAWVGTHAPHYLSSKRSFSLYIKGWDVVNKIRRAKHEGSFQLALYEWRRLVRELPTSWRSGKLFSDPPAYLRRTA